MEDTTFRVLQNMMEMGMIKEGDENMLFRSPRNEFIFEMNRYENQLWVDTDGASYIIEISIKNMIGTELSKIRFSEIKALEILDCMNEFVTEYNHSGISQPDINIYINPNNARLETPIIQLKRLPESTIVDLDSIGNKRDILFSIEQYSPYHETILPLVVFNLSIAELSNFEYCLLFVGLIDIELPYPASENLDDIASNILSSNQYYEYPHS
jgi:hypothetical protein